MFPFDGLRLLLPAIVPSWRFFDAVTSSPRIDYAVLPSPEAEPDRDWQEFRARVAVLTPKAMLRRLVWNPEWNENLYLVSLAERLVSHTTPATEAHSEHELLRRIARHCERRGLCERQGWLQIRLRFVQRTGSAEEVTSEVAYVSAPHAIAALVAS